MREFSKRPTRPDFRRRRIHEYGDPIRFEYFAYSRILSDFVIIPHFLIYSFLLFTNSIPFYPHFVYVNVIAIRLWSEEDQLQTIILVILKFLKKVIFNLGRNYWIILYALKDFKDLNKISTFFFLLILLLFLHMKLGYYTIKIHVRNMRQVFKFFFHFRSLYSDNEEYNRTRYFTHDKFNYLKIKEI